MVRDKLHEGSTEILFEHRKGVPDRKSIVAAEADASAHISRGSTYWHMQHRLQSMPCSVTLKPGKGRLG